MQWKKRKLSIIERIKQIPRGLEWLSLTVIDVYDFDTNEWYRGQYPFIDRWNCFLSSLETCICGYVWRLEEKQIVADLSNVFT